MFPNRVRITFQNGGASLKFLSSIQLAVILIAAIIGFSVSSTLYDMPEVFSSWPFRIVTALFFLNLLLCSAELWPGLYRTLRKKPGDVPESNLRATDLNEETFEQTLKAQRFHVQVTNISEGRKFLAVKGRVALLAPHVLHIGLLVIILGAFLTTFGTTGQLSLGPGQSHALPTEISKRTGPGIITVEDFVTEYDDRGARSNWITTFDLAMEGKPVIENETTRVNSPFQHRGLSIYQMAYSDHHIVEMSGNSELEGTYALPENQRFPVGDETFRFIPMTADVALLMVYDRNDQETLQKAMSAGTTHQFADGSTLAYVEPYSYTVLQFKYNMATPLVFLGFIIASLASFMLLTGRYQEVRALVTPDGSVLTSVFCKNTDIREKLKNDFGLVQAEKERSDE